MVFVEISGSAGSGKTVLLNKLSELLGAEVQYAGYNNPKVVSTLSEDTLAEDSLLMFDECLPAQVEKLKLLCGESRKRGVVVCVRAA